MSRQKDSKKLAWYKKMRKKNSSIQDSQLLKMWNEKIGKQEKVEVPVPAPTPTTPTPPPPPPSETTPAPTA